MDKQECVGAIVCKLDRYKEANRGYIAMLDVDEKYRRKKIGSNLVNSAIKRMIQHNADEVNNKKIRKTSEFILH
jgi:N-alpha-acetyltransferase 30